MHLLLARKVRRRRRVARTSARPTTPVTASVWTGRTAKMAAAVREGEGASWRLLLRKPGSPEGWGGGQGGSGDWLPLPLLKVWRLFGDDFH